MTSPQPIVIKQEGWGQAIQQGLAPLLQALQQTQQRKLQQQQIDLERQRTEAQVAQTKLQTEQLRLQGDQRAKDLKDASDAAKIFQKTMEANEGELTTALVQDMLAQAKTPGAIRHLMGMIPGFAEALRAPSGVAEAKLAERKAIADLDNFEVMQEFTNLDRSVRTKSLRYAERLLNNPDKPFRLPTDATLRDAIGLSALGMLNQAQQQLELEASSAGGGNQAIIFARMQANAASAAAVREYFTEMENLEVAEMAQRPGPMAKERLEKFLGGMSYDTYVKLTKTASEGALRTLGFEAPVQQEGVIGEFLALDAMKDIDPATAQGIINTAQDIVSGATPGIAPGTPPHIRSLIRNLVTKLRAQRKR